MAALGLALALFLYWTTLGFGLVSVLNYRRDTLRNLLLAPSAGIAATLWPVFLLNRAGLPVARFGPALLVVLLIVSGILFWRARPSLPVKNYLPFAVVLLAALLVVGRPMLEFGFDWISYANDDMANYVLGAHFFLDNAFPNVPDVSRLVSGSDYSLYYWFFYIPHAVRPGSEMLLAWVISLTRLTGHQAFMPLILSLHLALISTAAALVLRGDRYRLAAVVTASLLAVSALTTFGTLAQLIGQVAGLTLLAGCATLILRPLDAFTGWRALQLGVLVGLLGAALLVIYPEVLPFIGLAFIGYVGIAALRKNLSPWALTRVVIAACLTGVVLVNAYLIDVVLFMSIQLTGGLRPGTANGFIFPYFLLPSGLADFWGIQTIDRMTLEPWRSLGIFAGGVLLVLALVCSVPLSWRGHAAPMVALVMLAFGGLLFTRAADFGLFKLALFAQPFVLGALALGLCRPGRWLRWQSLPLVLVAAGGLAGQHNYVERSRGQFNEIPNGSQSHISTEFHRLIESVQPRQIIVDTINISLAKVQALYTRGLDTNFPSRDFFSYIIGRDLRDAVIVPGTYEEARAARDAVDSRFMPAFFALKDPIEPNAVDEFRINTLGQSSSEQLTCDAFVGTTTSQSIFNRRASSSEAGARSDFTSRPCAQVRNHVIFVHSKLGQHYYQVDQHYFGEDTPTIGIFGMEQDILFGDQTMAGVGRYQLLQIVGAAPRVRVALDLTASLKADSENLLPPAVAIGTERQPFPLEGRGAARVFSPPLTPQMIGGRTYVAIDMGVDGQRFPEDRGALMALYGTDIPFDRRELVGFARDISVVADDDYSRLAPPAAVQHFPSDLRNPALVFSGVYEDGWLSESSFFELTQPPGVTLLTVRGMLPLIGNASFTTDVQMLIDGQVVAQASLKPGEFRLDAPIGTHPGTHRVGLHFSGLQRLVAPDTRPVASLLQSIGYSPVTGGGSYAGLVPDIVAADSGVALRGNGWYPLENFAGELFRWVNNDAEIVVPPSTAADRRLRLKVESGPGLGQAPFDLQLLDADGQVLVSVPAVERQVIALPVPPTPTAATTLRLHVDGGGQPAPDDPRTLNFRVFSIGWDSLP